MKEIQIIDLQHLQEASRVFLEKNQGKKAFAFFGDLGAGKTTFIKALCNELDVVDIVTSPTFSIINEYQAADSRSVYHMDFYRLEDIDEAHNLGLEDYFESTGYCFIEWPEKIEEMLPLDVVFVQIIVNDDQTRTLKFL